MFGPLESWRGAVVGIDGIVVVLEGGCRRFAKGHLTTKLSQFGTKKLQKKKKGELS